MPMSRYAPLILLLATACGGETNLAIPDPQPLDVPAGAGAAQPFVASHGDGVIVSWTEPAGEGHALRFAEWDDGWSEVRTVAAGADWFVNWADFPSVLAVNGGLWAAHWLQRSGPGRYSYDVMVTTSADGGRTWNPPAAPHGDATETEHGFASIFPHAGDAAVVWLDGRRFAETEAGPATNQMQLRFATLAAGAGATNTGLEVLLDDRICDCCQTAVAVTTQGPVVVFRDRLEGEIRDISVTRQVDGAWTQPVRIHDDGWVINACPVNGPAATADGDNVAVAWFTGASETPRVRAAFSRDAGATFSYPVTVDDGAPVGRVDIVMLRDGSALVVWMERVGEDAEVRGRVIAADGTPGDSRTLAATGAGRSAGFPRMSRRGDDVVLAWTEPGDPSRVRAALLPFSRR
jgi:hypothetical protein